MRVAPAEKRQDRQTRAGRIAHGHLPATVLFLVGGEPFEGGIDRGHLSGGQRSEIDGRAIIGGPERRDGRAGHGREGEQAGCQPGPAAHAHRIVAAIRLQQPFNAADEARSLIECSPTARAIGLLVRSRTGWKADDERIVRGAARVAATAPTDLYFAYHAAPLLEAVGGEKPQAWRKELRDALLAGQVRDGEHKGSWLDGFGGGNYIRDDRLMCTALATLALETPLVHRPAKPVPENSP